MVDRFLWILQSSLPAIFAGSAIISALSALVAAILGIRAYRLTRLARQNSGMMSDTTENEHIKLLCGDAKVLADLAIQRHMDDGLFRRRLTAQPCYPELYPLFAPSFRQRLDHDQWDSDGRASLASACREEIERLEREVTA